MTPSPPRSVAELTVWAASHPGGAADEIKRLTDALDELRSVLEVERARAHRLADEVEARTIRDGAAGIVAAGSRGYVRGLDFALASFSDRPDERNRT